MLVNSRMRFLVSTLCALLVSAPAAAFAICGDGNLETGEQCDDSNVTAGDGCDATCQIEPAFVNLCSDGRDGSPVISTCTVVNTYFPAEDTSTGFEAMVATGATELPVGTVRGDGFCSCSQDTDLDGQPNTLCAQGSSIQAGDTLLIIQMQGAEIDAGDSIDPDDPYGDGAGAATNDRAGYLNTGEFRAGQYEFVVALGPPSGGTIPILGRGAGGGTLNEYVNSRVVTASMGYQTYQVLRVPNYEDMTIESGGTVSPMP